MSSRGMGGGEVLMISVATAAALLFAALAGAQPLTGEKRSATAHASQALLERYCLRCHSEQRLAEGLVPVSFSQLDLNDVGADAATWELVVRKLRLGMMPPAGRGDPPGSPHASLNSSAPICQASKESPHERRSIDRAGQESWLSLQAPRLGAGAGPAPRTLDRRPQRAGGHRHARRRRGVSPQ